MLDFLPSPTMSRFAFGSHDEVRINGIAYRPIDRTEYGYVFVRTDSTGVAESFSHNEMARLVELGRVSHDRGAFLPESAKDRVQVPYNVLSTRKPEEHWRARSREAVVLAFLEKERKGKVKRTEESIALALDSIMQRAGEIFRVPSELDEVTIPPGVKVAPNDASERSIRRWVKAYEAHGIAGLYDKIARRGNRARRMSPDELALFRRAVDGFLSPEQPSKENIYQDVRRAFRDENIRRVADGKPKMVPPSRETVRRAIKALDPFQCDVARLGLDAARKKHAPVGAGLDLARPLQRVEMDAWTVDLMTLMATSGVLDILSEEDKIRLGLDNKKKRWRLTVAECATTRCFVGMRLSRSPNSSSSIATLEMVLRDKGVWADAVGALTPWNMAGVPELVVTDSGNEFISYDVRVAATDAGIRLEDAPAGIPELRGRVERAFGTVARSLTPRLTGRTFSSIIARGDYDPKAHAALTADDLCAALIRWVVDIYHRTPHRGLGGETPLDCWNRLTDKYGVAPAPDLRRRRLAFGTRMTRTVFKTGITMFGVEYQSDTLASWRIHAKDKVVRVRWYAEDIGSIEVELDGKWIEVPAVFARFNGVRAQTWLAAARELRAAYQRRATFHEDVIFDAIADIERINGDAMRRIGLLVEDWSEERLLQEEERLFIGFSCQATDRGQSRPAEDTAWGEELPTATQAGAAPGGPTRLSESCVSSAQDIAPRNQGGGENGRDTTTDANDPDWDW